MLEKLTKDQLKRYFLTANAGSSMTHLMIGNMYYVGNRGFPKDIIQAKKHFLKATILLADTPDLNKRSKVLLQTLHASSIRKIEIEIVEKRPCTYEEADASIMASPSKLENLKEELASIEAAYGVQSEFEKAALLESPKSLKDICIKYIIKNSEIFSPKIDVLSQDLQDDLSEATLHQPK